MSFLATILERKMEEVSLARAERPLDQLRRSPRYHGPCRSLRSALLASPFGIVAEVKKASPSKGVLRPDFRPVDIARSYHAGGAAALSVLTDKDFFQGSLSSLTEIRDAVELPALRKDFLIDAYQLHEAKAAGADAVLLIVAALTPAELEHLQGEAAEIGLECLVEVHTHEELSAALNAGADLIGINNRNLETFETDIMTCVRLAADLPAGTVAIGESAISTLGDLELLRTSGLRGALIGEAFMRAPDPGEALRRILKGMKR
jgi:indole-3-glycerol phosphate synthase